MRSWILPVALAAQCAFGASVHAAALDAIQGTVMVNSGTGFKPVGENYVVNPGDKILVSPGGSVRIVYSEGCWEDVEISGVKTVPAKPSCVGGEQNANAPGGEGGAPGPLTPTTSLIIGGVAIAGGVAAAVAVNNSGGKDPASP